MKPRKTCSTHRTAKSTKGWSRAEVRSQGKRRDLAAKCGTGAFLVQRDGELKFQAVGKGCCVDCRALRAALSRAGIHRKKYPGLQDKIRRRGKAAGCRWAK